MFRYLDEILSLVFDILHEYTILFRYRIEVLHDSIAPARTQCSGETPSQNKGEGL